MEEAITEWDRLRNALREDFSVSLLIEFEGFLKSLGLHVRKFWPIMSSIISFTKAQDNRFFVLIFEIIHEHPFFLKKLGFEKEMRNILENISNNQAKEAWLSHTALILEDLPRSLPVWRRLESRLGQTFTAVHEILGCIKKQSSDRPKFREIVDDFSSLIPWYPASNIGISLLDEFVVMFNDLPVKFLDALFLAPSFIYQQLSTKTRTMYFFRCFTQLFHRAV